MKINSRKELEQYLDLQDFESKKITPLSSVYFLLTYNNTEHPIYFFPYEGFYFESPCVLYRYEMTEEELIEYVKEQYMEEFFEESLAYEKTLYRNGFLYEIDNLQTEPFLPDIIDDIKMIDEIECLEWMLAHSK